MTTDRYTKVVLTVIAAALVWLCVKDVSLAETVHAQQFAVEKGVKSVIIVGIENPGVSRTFTASGTRRDLLPTR